MEFMSLCNKVAGELKEGWKMEIELENGYGGVKLIDPDNCLCELELDEDATLEDQIIQCIYISKEI